MAHDYPSGLDSDAAPIADVQSGDESVRVLACVAAQVPAWKSHAMALRFASGYPLDTVDPESKSGAFGGRNTGKAYLHWHAPTVWRGLQHTGAGKSWRIPWQPFRPYRFAIHGQIAIPAGFARAFAGGVVIRACGSKISKFARQSTKTGDFGYAVAT